MDLLEFGKKYLLFLFIVFLTFAALEYYGMVSHETRNRSKNSLFFFLSFFFFSPQSNSGFWKKTANIDWCEGNYEYNTYVAEWWNTISSMYMTLCGFLGMMFCLYSKYPVRFAMAYFSLFIVGAGSALFHATLSYQGQIADEIPMSYLGVIFIYILHVHSVQDDDYSYSIGYYVGFTLISNILYFATLGHYITIYMIMSIYYYFRKPSSISNILWMYGCIYLV